MTACLEEAIVKRQEEILPGLIRPGSNTSYNFHFADRGNTARPVRLMQKSQQGAPKILEHCG